MRFKDKFSVIASSSVEEAKKPAATFWDDPEPSQARAKVGWTEDRGQAARRAAKSASDTSPRMEAERAATSTRTQIGHGVYLDDGVTPASAPSMDSRAYGQAAMNARQEDIHPTSRQRINGFNHRQALEDDDQGYWSIPFSTHRAEHSSHPEGVAKRAAARERKHKEQEERAMRGMAFFLKLVSMGAGHG